MIKQLRRY